MVLQIPLVQPADVWDRRVIVAIPACNEADRIGACLAALALQRQPSGAPLAEDLFGVVVLANNCRDETAEVARALAPRLPFPLDVVECSFEPARSTAGWARKTAMDRAAALLAHRRDGLILSTDADSTVHSTWIANTLAAFERGVDAVMGYIEGHPGELVTLGRAFLQRGWLEDTYLAAIAEIVSRCDPLPHDPWPRHRVASGASLAVTAEAYRAIGGLPPKPLGEDAALREALLGHGFKIRHALDVCVTTSCRLDCRAAGGAADTMRARHEDPDAPCDADMEPARAILRRASWRGRMRHWYDGDNPVFPLSWVARTGVAASAALDLRRETAAFEPFWTRFEQASPRLAHHTPLRPSQLPVAIEQAHAILRRLRIRPAALLRSTLALPNARPSRDDAPIMVDQPASCAPGIGPLTGSLRTPLS